MNKEEQSRYEAAFTQYLKGQVSRANLLKTAGVGLALAVAPGVASAQIAGGTGAAASQTFPFFPQIPSGSYTPEAIRDILNMAQTAEYLAVTVVTAAIGNAKQLNLSTLLVSVLQAALASEQAHVDFLAAIGATPLTTTFTVPDPKILTDAGTFFSTLEAAETVFVGAYMAATREFAELGQPTLAKYAYQIGAVESEHRVLARSALALAGVQGAVPPNNKGFETDYFLYVRDAAKVLSDLGFVGGSGPSASYPGRDAALAAAGPMAAALLQKGPNNAVVSSTAANTLTGERGSTP